ncbi:MAG: 50S ribosomal protein L31e [Candidatus Bathyarchaeia archaeon]
MEEKAEEALKTETEKGEEPPPEEGEALEPEALEEEEEAEIGGEGAEGEIFEEEEIEEEEVPRRGEEEEEKFVEERIYTVPLRRAWIVPPKKRAAKAIRILKAFVQRHMKVGKAVIEEEEEGEGGRIIISNEVNEKIWSRGIEKPPRKLRIRAAKDEEGNVKIFLA